MLPLLPLIALKERVSMPFIERGQSGARLAGVCGRGRRSAYMLLGNQAVLPAHARFT